MPCASTRPSRASVLHSGSLGPLPVPPTRRSRRFRDPSASSSVYRSAEHLAAGIANHARSGSDQCHIDRAADLASLPQTTMRCAAGARHVSPSPAARITAMSRARATLVPARRNGVAGEHRRPPQHASPGATAATASARSSPQLTASSGNTASVPAGNGSPTSIRQDGDGENRRVRAGIGDRGGFDSKTVTQRYRLRRPLRATTSSASTRFAARRSIDACCGFTGVDLRLDERQNRVERRQARDTLNAGFDRPFSLCHAHESGHSVDTDCLVYIRLHLAKLLDRPPPRTMTLRMTEKTLNLRGLKCPLPALRTRKALGGMEAGDILIVECTDPLAGIDIPNLLNQTGDTLEATRKEKKPADVSDPEALATVRHSRESGIRNPCSANTAQPVVMGPRFRGDDQIIPSSSQPSGSPASSAAPRGRRRR